VQTANKLSKAMLPFCKNLHIVMDNDLTPPFNKVIIISARISDNHHLQ